MVTQQNILDADMSGKRPEKEKEKEKEKRKLSSVQQSSRRRRKRKKETIVRTAEEAAYGEIHGCRAKQDRTLGCEDSPVAESLEWVPRAEN